MNFQFDDLHLAFREEVRQFIAQKLPADMAERQRRSPLPGNWSDMLAWSRLLHERGWSVPRWPAEHGGTGWTPLQEFIFEQEQANHDAPGLHMPNVAMVGPVIYKFGSDEQKARFLPPIREGKVAWCQGFSEPGAGSDLASLRTAAVRKDDKYIVNGQKIWTSGAFESDWCFALVRTDTTVKPQRGISFLLIDLKSPGITVRRIPQINGESHLCEVFYEDVAVPAENLVGEEGAGWTFGKFLLDNERTSSAFIFWNRREMRRTIELAKSVTRGGRKVAEIDRFRARIAALEAKVRALEWSVLRVLAGEPRPFHVSAIASALKLRGAELQQSITDLQVDILAERSLREFDVEAGEMAPLEASPFWPDFVPGITSVALLARAATIYGGSQQIQGTVIAKAAFGL